MLPPTDSKVELEAQSSPAARKRSSSEGEQEALANSMAKRVKLASQEAARCVW